MTRIKRSNFGFSFHLNVFNYSEIIALRQEVKGKRYNALVREERMKSWFSPKYDVYTTVRSIELISALTGIVDS